MSKVHSLEQERESGLTGAGSTMQVGDWLHFWLTNIQPRRVRPRTLEAYESIVRRHVQPRIGGCRLGALRPDHLDSLYTRLQRDGLSAATVLRVHRILSRALRVAVQRELVARNVADLVDPPSAPPSAVGQPLTVEETLAVLATAASRRNGARWSVALALGLRQSEALALQWTDLDLTNSTLTVRRTQHHVRGHGVVYAEPKTQRSRRTIAMPHTLATALEQHRQMQTAERAHAGSVWRDENLIFAQPDGRPVGKTSDYNDWCEVLHAAGVRHVRLHDARHTAATLLLQEGVQARVVMDLLGHSQMRTTTDLYSHVMPALAREAADAMDRVLGTV